MNRAHDNAIQQGRTCRCTACRAAREAEQGIVRLTEQELDVLRTAAIILAEHDGQRLDSIITREKAGVPTPSDERMFAKHSERQREARGLALRFEVMQLRLRELRLTTPPTLKHSEVAISHAQAREDARALVEGREPRLIATMTDIEKIEGGQS